MNAYLKSKNLMRVTESDATLLSNLIANIDQMIDCDWQYHTSPDSEFRMNHIVISLNIVRALRHFDPGFDESDLIDWSRDQADQEMSDKIERFLFGATFEEIDQSDLDWKEIQARRYRGQSQAEAWHNEMNEHSQIAWLQSMNN